MALIDDKPRVLAALRAIPGVKAALPAWPKDWAQLPCVVAEEVGNAPADLRDNQAYLTVVEMCVRAFADTAAERASVASAADDAMLALGYWRALAREEDGADLRQTVLRYKQIF